eukprot:TRINITY_DN3371_c0_g5_i1.p1 TRINITY_DN3371_c0_g5~~TRINITY_DN3371_c0_g5_i1.p1  ORF type:complete len:305 (+),score=56.97 TRINITY_DN3371_c0_g5_i1:159-1073(+)
MDKRIKKLSLPCPPLLTAKSWAILNANTGELLSGHHEHERREIASLTKVMTAYTAIQIITNLNINVTESKVEASCDASSLNGTTAELEEGDVLSLWDMLHAMLLPSGNDAAYALAEYFGLALVELGLRTTKVVDPIQVFVHEMNRNAKALGMSNTNYANPHGLQNCFNKSSALDVVRLSAAAMRLPLFAEIVSKQKHKCMGQDINSREKAFVWHNTNRLLAKGFSGLKTGITPSAGPCLASSYKDERVNLVMVLLSCKTPEHRWSETIKMKDWSVKMLVKTKEDDEPKKATTFASKKHTKILCC